MRKPGRWSLRSRLAVTVALLTALGLLVTGGTSVVLYRSYLIDQVDHRLTLMTSQFSGVSPADLTAMRTVSSRFGSALPSLDADQSRLLVATDQGVQQMLPDTRASGPHLPARDRLAAHAGKKAFTVSGDDGVSWRVQVVVSPQYDVLLIAASSLERVDAGVTWLTVIDGVVLVLVLGLVSLLARALAGVGLRPLSRMEETAGQIASGDYTQRVSDTDGHTEPGRLGRAMNVMLGRVEREINARKASEERMRRFLADASHELRTPLTSVLGFAELARRGGPAAESLARIEAEAGRMGVLVNDLLLLARLDEQRPLDLAPVDLLGLAAELVRDVHVRHPDRTITLSGLDPGSSLFEPVVVRGDVLRLRQVIGNLLDNAVRHTPAEASVAVRVGSRDGEAVVEVADTGPGIAEKDAPYVFERLYRADAARTSDGGTGLGLAIAAAIVAAHDGRVELASTPGGGATFRMFLPIPS